MDNELLYTINFKSCLLFAIFARLCIEIRIFLMFPQFLVTIREDEELV